VIFQRNSFFSTAHHRRRDESFPFFLSYRLMLEYTDSLDVATMEWLALSQCCFVIIISFPFRIYSKNEWLVWPKPRTKERKEEDLYLSVWLNNSFERRKQGKHQRSRFVRRLTCSGLPFLSFPSYLLASYSNLADLHKHLSSHICILTLMKLSTMCVECTSIRNVFMEIPFIVVAFSVFYVKTICSC
jgi:hypothetical protein